MRRDDAQGPRTDRPPVAAQDRDAGGGVSGRSTPREVLRWLDALYRAVERRDQRRLAELLECREARHAARELREEALALARAAPASVRAPLALLRFAHQLRQLEALGEPMPGVFPSPQSLEVLRDDAAAGPGDEAHRTLPLEFGWGGTSGGWR